MKNKDLINVGIFTALYICVNVIISGFVIVPILQVLMMPAMALLLAPIYLLYIAKVGKFGAILITGFCFSALIGLLVYGNVICFLVNFAFFIAAELVAYLGKYKNKKLNALSYIFAIFSTIAEAGLPWFASQYFYDLSVASGYSVEWAEGLKAIATPLVFVLMLVGVIVCSIISILFSNNMFKKHFKKAGIV